MTTDNPTSPKGSGGPPDPGNCVGGREERMWPDFPYEATPLYRACDWMREPNTNGRTPYIGGRDVDPTPDESEPAPPTDGSTDVVHHVTCPVHEDQIAALEHERDEARRGWCEAIAGEYGTPGPVGGREYAAQKWGRDVALDLYPDEAIKVALMEYMPEDEAIEETARYRHDFDRATTQEPPAKEPTCSGQ